MRGPRGAGPRLSAIAALIPFGSRVADVGTDHARLPQLLLDCGRATLCIATERTARQVRAAIEMLDGHDGRIELRAGDGLAPLAPDDRIDVIVLAGMGGATAAAILEEGLPRLAPRRLVLQPQSGAATLRRWLRDHGWRLAEERFVEERGRSYVVLAATRDADPPPDHPSLDEEDLLEAGPLLVRSGDPALRRWWEVRLAAAERDLAGADHPTARERANRRRERARRVVAALADAELL